MPKLIIEQVSAPKSWFNKGTGKQMLGYFVHGELDGNPAEGTINCVDPQNGVAPKNAPFPGQSVEVTVKTTSMGLIFSRVSQYNNSTGSYTPGQSVHYDDISDLTRTPETKRSNMQPVDANSCIARAIEFVTKDPAFTVTDEDWAKVDYYARKAAELQKELLAS